MKTKGSQRDSNLYQGIGETALHVVSSANAVLEIAREMSRISDKVDDEKTKLQLANLAERLAQISGDIARLTKVASAVSGAALVVHLALKLINSAKGARDLSSNIENQELSEKFEEELGKLARISGSLAKDMKGSFDPKGIKE
ncbi:MAG: hypothetical protein ACPGNV_18005 [Mangrovicoccus sp.]